MRTKTTSFIWELRVLSLLFLVMLLTTQFLVAQSWYDAGWQFRRIIAVAGNGSTTLSGQQVKIELNTNTFDFSQANSDGRDIRFTQNDGTTLIPFWIENWDNALQQATIWIKVPSIPPTGSSVCMYYNNPVSTSVSSGENTFEFFDDFENWSQSSVGWMNGSSLPTPRADVATAVHDGKLYLFGGYGASALDIRRETFEYDPINDVWDEANAPMPTARWGMIAVEYGDGIYVFGGEGVGSLGTPVNERYNPTYDTWVTMPRPLPAELATHGLMGVVFGDKIHLFCMNAHYEYDPILDTYTPKAAVPRRIKWGTCAVANSSPSGDPRIYIIGGNSYDDPPEASYFNYAYNPADDTWEVKTQMPVRRYGATRENPVIDGKIYVTHGQAYNHFYSTNFVYDPVMDTWAQKQPSLYKRDGMGCAVINNKLYVIGGRNVPTNPYGLSVNEIYDPAADSWNPKWSLTHIMDAYPDAVASYEGNYGMALDKPDYPPSEFTTMQGFGNSYAVDLFWNLLTDYPDPWGQLYISDGDGAARLDFLNDEGTPSIYWWGAQTYTYLQASTFNNWHKLTIIRDGENSRVVFDGTEHNVSATPGGLGQVRFRLSDPAKEYIDVVRIRKWAGTDLKTIVGPGLRDGQTLSIWTGSTDNDWEKAGNWSSGLLPGTADYIIIPDVSNDPVCTSLTISSSATLDIEPGGSLTVSNELTNNGTIKIQSSDLTSSGSLIVNGTSSGNVTYNRQMRTEANDGDYHYFSSPVASNSATNSAKVSAVWQWDEVTGEWSTLNMSDLNSGIGYNLDQTVESDGLISFTGSLVSEDPILIDATSPYRDVITTDIINYNTQREYITLADLGHSEKTRSYTDYGGGGWNLLGNPYTSAILVSDFITANLTQFDPNYVAVYLYDGTSPGHARYYYIGNSTGWGDPITQTHVQVGQGFFVLAMNDYSTFTFNKAMQHHSTGAAFLKSAGAKDRWPGLQLKVKTGNDENLTTIVFNDEMTSGLDPGYDLGLMSNGPGAGIYTALVEDNGVNFTRQALPLNGAVKNIIPIGIDFENGGKVTFSANIEPLRNFKFWLEDRTTGITTDLGTDTYSVTLPAKTYGTGRFFVYVAAARSTRPRQVNTSQLDVRIWSTQMRQVNIQGIVSDKTTCEVYDTYGKKIFETRLSDGGFNSFNMPSVGKGVYIVKIKDREKVITQKVLFL